MIPDYIKIAVVNKLPDVTNKIYLLQKEIINDDNEVETIYEEWIFTPECLGKLDIDINEYYEEICEPYKTKRVIKKEKSND